MHKIYLVHFVRIYSRRCNLKSLSCFLSCCCTAASVYCEISIAFSCSKVQSTSTYIHPTYTLIEYICVLTFYVYLLRLLCASLLRPLCLFASIAAAILIELRHAAVARFVLYALLTPLCTRFFINSTTVPTGFCTWMYSVYSVINLLFIHTEMANQSHRIRFMCKAVS